MLIKIFFKLLVHFSPEITPASVAVRKLFDH